MCNKAVHNDCPFDPPPKKITRREIWEALFWLGVSLILAILIASVYFRDEDLRPSNEFIRQNRSHW